MTPSQNISPEDQAAIDAELHPFNGATVSLGRPSAPIDSRSVEKPSAEFMEGTPVLSKPQEQEVSVSAPTLRISFSPEPGAFSGTSLELELKCEAPHTRILYALGTDHVDENGLYYDSQQPILLTQTTLVAARAALENELGPVQQGRFEINKPQWQEIEPKDQSDPFPHKLNEKLVLKDEWRVAAGSVRGKLHAHRGSWREDAFAIAQVETDGGVWSLSVVSDGAGSASSTLR